MKVNHIMKLIFALAHLVSTVTGAVVVLPKGHFPVVSQTSITNQSDFPSGYGQTFTVTTAVSIDALALGVRGGSGGADFDVELHRFDPLTSSVNSLVLGRASVSKSLVGVSNVSWLAIYFDVSTSAAVGETFAFVIKHTSGGSGYNRYGNSQANPYAGGSRLGGYDFQSSGQDQVSLLLSTDFAFEIISVPEPSAPFILSLGILGIISRRHRHQPRVHGSLPRERLHPHQREEDFLPQGHASAP